MPGNNATCRGRRRCRRRPPPTSHHPTLAPALCIIHHRCNLDLGLEPPAAHMCLVGFHSTSHQVVMGGTKDPASIKHRLDNVGL